MRPHTFFLLTVLFLITACSSSTTQDGNGAVGTDPMGIVPDKVLTDSLLIQPNPVTGEETPAEFQQGVFYRYRLEPGASVRAILVLVPGTNGGAGDFDYMARELIRRSRGTVEVWAFERRPNLIEDLTGMEAAEAAGDVQVAIDYYFNDAGIQGKAFDGFLGQDDVSYLSEWGLDSVMHDIRAAIARVPETRRATNVFLGGHSLGASQVLSFLGWDFDGDASTLDDSGFNQLAGAILFEGGARSPRPPASREEYEASVQGIRSGSSQRFGGFPLITPEVVALLEIAGMVAHPAFDDPNDPDDGPDGLSHLKDIPYGPDADLLLTALFAEDILDILCNRPPGYRDFEVTNEALLGLVLDDNFEPISAQQASVGIITPQAGVVPRNLLGFPGYVLTDPAPVYGWLNFDEVDGAGLTTPEEEVTDITVLAEVQWRGPMNFSEWYFGLRPGIDAQATGSLTDLPDDGWQATAYGLSAFHTSRIDVPVLAIGGGSGLTPDAEGYNSVRDAIADPARDGTPRSSEASFKVRILEGMNHLDVLLAQSGTEKGDDLYDEILDFLYQHAEGEVLVP